MVDAVVDDLLLDVEGIHHFLGEGFLIVLILAGLNDFVYYGNL